MTIDVGERDVEIRVTLDIEGDIGLLRICKSGVAVNGQFIPWNCANLHDEFVRFIQELNS